MVKVIWGLLLAFSVHALDDYDLAYFGKDSKVEVPLQQNLIAGINFVENEEELNVLWKAVNEPGTEMYSWTVKGFSIVGKDGGCIIVVPKLNNWDERDKLAILGHEVLHCLGGEHNAPIDLH